MFNPIQEARDGETALTYFERWEAGEALPVFILLDLKLPQLERSSWRYLLPSHHSRQACGDLLTQRRRENLYIFPRRG